MNRPVGNPVNTQRPWQSRARDCVLPPAGCPSRGTLRSPICATAVRPHEGLGFDTPLSRYVADPADHHEPYLSEPDRIQESLTRDTLRPS